MKYREDFLKDNILLEDMQGIYRSAEMWDSLTDSSIYVTGASGMIASYLIMFLIYLNEVYEQRIEIYAGVRSIDKAYKRFGEYVEKEYFHLVQGDVCEPVNVEKPLDYIIHAASLASPQYYGRMPVETMMPNVIGTYEMLKYAVENPIKGFLLFSSGSVYGSINGIDSVDETAVGGMDWLAPGNVYGESKRCGEAMCAAYFREFGVPVKIARIHHTYGPTMDVRSDARVFAEFSNNILNGRNIVLKSDGKERRAFCYLQDTVSGLFKIMLEGTEGECYNVGNPDAFISIRQLAEILIGIFPEKNLTVEYQKRVGTGYCASPVKRQIPVSMEKLNSLGWKAEVTVQDGFTRSLRYLAKEWGENI